MATTKGQRIGIWVIAAFMLFGTIGSFMAIIFASKNSQSDAARLKELTAQYQDAMTAYQKKVDAQTAELSSRYFEFFSSFQSRVSAFDAASVTSLSSQDLQVGTGDELNSDSSFSAYYIGWSPSGEVFDSSIKDGALIAPFSVTPGGVITGWTEGTVGMRVGGVRELSIPSDKAYGETGSGDTIPPNTPLKFVIMVIPTPEAIESPEMPAELMQYYQTGRL